MGELSVMHSTADVDKLIESCPNNWLPLVLSSSHWCIIALGFIIRDMQVKEISTYVLLRQ